MLRAIERVAGPAGDMQDVRLERIERDSNRAKGAGWVILGLLSSFAVWFGGTVYAALSGHVKFH
jgi:hypothetical protein